MNRLTIAPIHATLSITNKNSIKLWSFDLAMRIELLRLNIHSIYHLRFGMIVGCEFYPIKNRNRMKWDLSITRMLAQSQS